MIIYCIIITILFLLLSFLYLRLRSDVRTGERQIEYIQKEKSAMKLSLPDSLPALRRPRLRLRRRKRAPAGHRQALHPKRSRHEVP